MNTKSLFRAGLCLLLMTMAACASGPRFSAVKPDLAAKAPEMGRIFFYRTTTLGAALQPKVRLNGEVVGKAVPLGFFYVDRPAGNYEVTTKTEVTRKLSFVLEEGGARFVKLAVSFGFFAGHVYGELVYESTALEEIQDCKYIGETGGLSEQEGKE